MAGKKIRSQGAARSSLIVLATRGAGLLASSCALTFWTPSVSASILLRAVVSSHFSLSGAL